MLLGPAAGGLVLGWSGVGGCYLVDAITFGLAFYGAFGLPPMRPDGEPSRPGLRGVADGLRFLVGNGTVRGALLTDLAATVLSMPISLFPLINQERFGGDPRTLGLFLSAIAVGGVVASVFSGTFTRLPRPGLVMLAGSTGWGVSLALFGVAPNAWLGLACLVFAGAADTVAVVSPRDDRPAVHAERDARPGGRGGADRRSGGAERRQHACRLGRERDVRAILAGERRGVVRRRGGRRRRHYPAAAQVVHSGPQNRWVTPFGRDPPVPRVRWR